MKKWIVLVILAICGFVIGFLVVWYVPVWADPLYLDISNEPTPIVLSSWPEWDTERMTLTVDAWDTNQEIRLFRIEQTLKRQQQKIEELQKQVDEIKKIFVQTKPGEIYPPIIDLPAIR